MKNRSITGVDGVTWYCDEERNYHREGNLPAVKWPNGDKSYVIHGKFHRTNGPAIDWVTRKEYWINGERLTFAEFFERLNLKQKKAFLLNLALGKNT